MGLVNATLIDARLKDLEQIAQNGTFIERIEAEGDTPEGLVQQAKDALQLESEDSLLVDGKEAAKRIYAKCQAFRDIVNFNNGATGNIVNVDEQAVLKGIESRLATEVAGLLDLEESDLYEFGGL